MWSESLWKRDGGAGWVARQVSEQTADPGEDGRGALPLPGGGGGPIEPEPCRRRGLGEQDAGPCGARRVGAARGGSRATATCAPALSIGRWLCRSACLPRSCRQEWSQHSSALGPLLSLFLSLLLFSLFPAIHFSLLFPSFSVIISSSI